MNEKLVGTYGLFIPLAELSAINEDFVRKNLKESDICRDKAVFGGRGIEKDAHITVHLGMPRDREIVERITSNIGPFLVRISDYGVFKTRDKVFSDGTTHSYDILSRKITSPGLVKFHKEMVAASGVPYEYDYKPHLTIAYLNPDVIDSSDVLKEVLESEDYLFKVDKVLYKKFKEDESEVFYLRGSSLLTENKKEEE